MVFTGLGLLSIDGRSFGSGVRRGREGALSESVMVRSDARVETVNGSKYLQQLCKHWSHKFPVENDALHGRIDLGDGRVCTLEAAADALNVSAAAPDADLLTRLEQVVAEHVKRFAFREDLVFDWRPAAA